VVGAVGDCPTLGSTLGGDRATVAARALAEGQMVVDLVDDEGESRLIIAVPSAGSSGAVAYQESIVRPEPSPQTPESPFRELRVAAPVRQTGVPQS
jgi:hypothetical protein